MTQVRNFAHCAPPEKQKQDGMFRWVQANPQSTVLMAGDVGCGIVDRRGKNTWAAVYVSDECHCLRLESPEAALDEAKDAVEEWWLSAAATAKALGLCEPDADPVPCFAVKDAAGHDHVYVTPEKAVRFRIASDGSLRDVVDVDGNPVETRKAERS